MREYRNIAQFYRWSLPDMAALTVAERRYWAEVVREEISRWNAKVSGDG